MASKRKQCYKHRRRKSPLSA